jgi:hypothetical protein
MSPDPILAEIRRYRDEHAAKFGYDVRKIAEDIKSREGKDGHVVVRRPPRPANPIYLKPLSTTQPQD